MMIPAGYLYKRVVVRPDGFADARVVDICSVSGHINAAFADYFAHWRHNACWLFDDPATMRDIAAAEGIDLAGMTLFYYEVLAEQFEEAARSWASIPGSWRAASAMRPPATKTLLGYDVVTFSQGNAPECSPLSCNGLSTRVAINAHCLLDTCAAACEALEKGVFYNSEPGPFRVLAVYSVADSHG